MTESSGKVVARPMEVRACGHRQEFQHYAVDRYRAQRLAKFQQTRCSECVAKVIEEERRQAEAVPKKGEVIKRLPPGTQMALTRRPDGTWMGTLSAEKRTVEVAGVPGAGPQSIIVALARLWVSEVGRAGREH